MKTKLYAKTSSAGGMLTSFPYEVWTRQVELRARVANFVVFSSPSSRNVEAYAYGHLRNSEGL